MFTIVVEQFLDVPADRAWKVLSDFGNHDRFSPFIERSTITNGVPVGEGAERELVLYDGSVLLQRIVDYQPGRSMVIAVVQSSQWIRHHLTEITLTPQAESRCLLCYRVSYHTPLGGLGFPIGWVYKVVLRSRYGHMMRGLKSHLQKQAQSDPTHG